MKPNLFIVGAAKCGTTAWVNYLASHPDIFFAKVKEPHHLPRIHLRPDEPTPLQWLRRDRTICSFVKSCRSDLVC